MFKLISILGVVTSSSSGIATTLNSVISNQQNTIVFNNKQQMYAIGPTKNKLGFNEMHTRVLNSQTTEYELYLTPELMEQTQRLVNGHPFDRLEQTKNIISIQFRRLISDYVAGVDPNDHKLMKELESLWRYGDNQSRDSNYRNHRTLRHNWQNIWNTYTRSTREQRIKIVFHGIKEPGFTRQFYLGTFQRYELVSENRVYFNKFSKWLERDFNNEINSISHPNNQETKVVRLGILPDANDDTIFSALKKRYPNLSLALYLGYISIAKKTDYSHFAKGYLLRLKINTDSSFYSSGEIQTDFFFNTEANVKRINDIFQNNQNVQLWLEHIKDWDINVRRQIKEDVPNFTSAQKRTWRDNVVEQMKTYIRDWVIIQTLIDHEIKLEELNQSVNDIKKDLDTLKEQIEIIKKQIVALQQGTPLGRKVLGYIGSVGGFIPVVGGIIMSAVRLSNTLWDVIDELKID